MKIKFLKKSGFLFLFFLFSMMTFSQSSSFKVEGTVTEKSTGETLIGVSVSEKGTTNGTLTDIDGRYSLTVRDDATLVFSYIGYTTKEVQVKDGNVNVVLDYSQQTLDEVVVVGYGVQKKSVVTAAISRVTSDDLNTTKPSRIEDALKGKVSGVQITQSSGQPGADSKVRIRGIGTVNNSEPLYIIDGMAVDGGINYLNPVDIESIEILKDAASAAIYGTRAANGVVLVTTKSGKEGKAVVNYNFSYGWQNPWKKKAVLNAEEYMVLMNESLINDNNLPRYSASQVAGAGKGTDWQNEIFNYDAPVQNHQLSLSGGNDKANYFLSVGYYSQEGIIGGNYDKSNYERWSIRSNSTYTAFEAKDRDYFSKVKVGVNIAYSRGKTKGIEVNSEYGSVLGSALAFTPVTPVYADAATAQDILTRYPYAVKDKNGNVFSLPPEGYQELANPVATLNQQRSEKNHEDKFVGTFWVEVDLLPELKFKSSYGFDLAFWGQDGYEFPYYLSSMKNNNQSSVWSQMNRGSKWQVENYFSYSKTFADVHNLTAVLGQSAQKGRARNLKGWDYDLFEFDPSKANINSGTADRDDERVEGGTNGYNFEALASYFGRLDYNFDERYMLQFTVRRDGSSRFGSRNKWATFPAVSLGWNVWNEPYLESLRPEWFDVFKVRFSWGKNGNERIGNFRYTTLMEGHRNYYFGTTTANKNGLLQYGAAPGGLGNPDIKWEESEQTDIGFDTRFLNGALNFSFDYFKKKTNGMLMDIPIPDYVGQGAPVGNVGDMENWGLEFEAGWKNKVGNVNYFVSANASYMKNKLINLGNANGEMIYENAGASGVGSYVKGKNGQVWPFFYGYKTDGIFQNDAEVAAHVNKDGKLLQPDARPGDVRFVDYNGDGSITDDDKTKIGKGMPDWTFGVTLGAEWNGFDVNLFFQGTTGNDIFDFSQRGDIPAMNRPSWMLNRWHGEGTSNHIPRMTTRNLNNNWRSSDIYVKNGNYLRLKTAQLGYTLPRAIVQKASIQNFRVYVSAENLFTFTGYDGFDPEVAAGSYTNIGVDKGIYPQSRTISVGANITF